MKIAVPRQSACSNIPIFKVNRHYLLESTPPCWDQASDHFLTAIQWFGNFFYSSAAPDWWNRAWDSIFITTSFYHHYWTTQSLPPFSCFELPPSSSLLRFLPGFFSRSPPMLHGTNFPCSFKTYMLLNFLEHFGQNLAFLGVTRSLLMHCWQKMWPQRKVAAVSRSRNSKAPLNSQLSLFFMPQMLWRLASSSRRRAEWRRPSRRACFPCCFSSSSSSVHSSCDSSHSSFMLVDVWFVFIVGVCQGKSVQLCFEKCQ